MSRVAPSSNSQSFDTALLAYSGQAVDLQEATGEPGIRVAGYCLVINQWHLLLWPREMDSAPRSCCGLREKTRLNFPEKGDGPKSQKGLPEHPVLTPPVSARVGIPGLIAGGPDYLLGRDGRTFPVAFVRESPSANGGSQFLTACF